MISKANVNVIISIRSLGYRGHLFMCFYQILIYLSRVSNYLSLSIRLFYIVRMYLITQDRIFGLMISRLSLNMGQVRSETMSLGQIVDNLVHTIEIAFLSSLKFCKKVCIDDI